MGWMKKLGGGEGIHQKIDESAKATPKRGKIDRYTRGGIYTFAAIGGLALLGGIGWIGSKVASAGSDDSPEAPRVVSELPACHGQEPQVFRFDEEPDGTVHVISVGNDKPVSVTFSGNNTIVDGSTAGDVDIVNGVEGITNAIRFGHDDSDPVVNLIATETNPGEDSTLIHSAQIIQICPGE